MERAIGEIFEIEGKKVKVVKGYVLCNKCFFFKIPCPCRVFMNIRGECVAEGREDNNYVYFVCV